MITRQSTGEPTQEPVTLAEAKAQLRIDDSASDSEVAAMISAARDAVEQYTNRYWSRQTIVTKFAAFPVGDAPFKYDLPDVDSVTALTYLDEDYATQSISAGSLTVDTDRQHFIYSSDWPTLGTDILVTFDVGPDASASPAGYVPQAIKQAILLYVTDLYENRGAQLPISLYDNRAVMALMQPYRVRIGV